MDVLNCSNSEGPTIPVGCSFAESRSSGSWQSTYIGRCRQPLTRTERRYAVPIACLVWVATGVVSDPSIRFPSMYVLRRLPVLCPRDKNRI